VYHFETLLSPVETTRALAFLSTFRIPQCAGLLARSPVSCGIHCQSFMYRTDHRATHEASLQVRKGPIGDKRLRRILEGTILFGLVVEGLVAYSFPSSLQKLAKLSVLNPDKSSNCTSKLSFWRYREAEKGTRRLPKRVTPFVQIGLVARGVSSRSSPGFLFRLSSTNSVMLQADPPSLQASCQL
jgi:hypothetical protein